VGREPPWWYGAHVAFVVARPGGRFEIRETRSVGGRTCARTLATFRTLDDDVLRRAAARAERPFDAEAVTRAAKAKGAALGPSRAALLAGELAIELGGRRAVIRPGLRRLLERKLAGEHDRREDHHLDRMLRWMHATPGERRDTILDLLEVMDVLPPRRYPRRYWWPRLDGVGVRTEAR